MKIFTVLIAAIARTSSGWKNYTSSFPVNDKQAIKNKVEFFSKRDRRR